jgi:hypothetical protein
MPHIDAQTLAAAGVCLHLLGAAAKALIKSPRRQAQIDAIERKLDEVLGELKAASK